MAQIRQMNSRLLSLEVLAEDKGTRVKKGFFAVIKNKALTQLRLS